ncbi:uncharacterized protein [Panulirus ornatus]|uniref:uncharacterized protein isoform X3 n=1 Tax=Panulirus ornatus TaxID=150431 RepID=UPI003A8AE7EB
MDIIPTGTMSSRQDPTEYDHGAAVVDSDSSRSSEEIRQSLDVLDRVLSEFDDIETDTNDESASPDVTANEGNHTPDSEPPEPPPVDRTLKPREVIPVPPELPRKTRLPRPASGSSSPSSHEYQEINSDVCASQRQPEAPIAPPPAPLASPSGRPVRRQMSEDRARRLRHEDDSRRQPRRQRSEDTRLCRDDVSSSSGDLMSVDVREKISKPRPMRDNSRGRSRESPRGPRDARDPGRDVREPRHLRKSRSGDVEARRLSHDQEQGRRRRSRSSDRWLDHSTHPEYLLDQRIPVDQAMFDPRMVDPRIIDPRMVDPRLIDPRLMDEPFPHPQDPIRFPHLMSYPPMAQPGPMSPSRMSTGAMSPVPPGPPMGPPFLPVEYPHYPLYPYELTYVQDPMLGPEVPFLPPHPGYPRDLPPEYLHPEFLPPDYPLEYALEYGPAAPSHPALMGGVWGAPGAQPREDWPPPSPEEARRLIHSVVRKPSRSVGEEDRGLTDGSQAKLHPGVRRSSRRLTSIGHSDSSGLSSPTEERRPLNRMQSSYRNNNQSFRDASSEFRVGEAVREASPRALMKSSTSLPHFSSGKDSGFDETPLVGDDGNNSGGRGGRTGGAFIVSGVFNDSSRMFIPAPPSPTPDYDDDGESDGNESDILQGSQFYVVSESKGDVEKKTVANRDSLSDDSLQNAPVMTKASKASKSVQKPTTPLQNMMKEFHQGLPLVENENGFSDDSLEDSTIGPSRPSTANQKPCRRNSMESLISVESSTASFDYMNAGQAKTSSYERTKSKPSPTTPVSGNIMVQKGTSFKDRKDINGKVKKSVPKSAENGFNHKGSSNKENENTQGDLGNFSRQSSRESSQSSGSNSSKPGEKFDTIRYMLKEGLIEGLDESPPQFKPPPPPPPPMKTPNGVHSDERADSGLGSAFSTTRTDESGGSDNRSDLSGTPPSLISPRDAENISKIKADSRKGKETVRSRSSIASEDMERNRDEGDEVEILMKETLEIPPPPPPRDESMHWTPRSSAAQKDQTKSARSVPTTPSTSKNSSWLHNNTSGKDEMTEVASDHFQHCSGDKITHVDDLYGQNEHESGSEVSSAINGSLASQYSAQDNDNPLTDREFLENLKNLEPRPRPDTLAVITEDQGSIGSRGSRSGRLLTRLAESVRSGSRTPTPSSSSSSTTRATTTKLTSTSRASTRIHGDIIREPWRSSLRESALPSPQEYARLPSLSPSVIPLTRDGSGRFRSIEDLAEAVSTPAEDTTLSGKKKKHSTLPPNLTPGDMKKENKELRRATSLMVGKKGKAGCCDQPQAVLSATQENPSTLQNDDQTATKAQNSGSTSSAGFGVGSNTPLTTKRKDSNTPAERSSLSATFRKCTKPLMFASRAKKKP